MPKMTEKEKERLERITEVLRRGTECVGGLKVVVEEIPEEYWILRQKKWKEECGLTFPEVEKMKELEGFEFVYEDKTKTRMFRYKNEAEEAMKKLKEDIKKGKEPDYVIVHYKSGYIYPQDFGDWIDWIREFEEKSNCVLKKL